MVQHALDPKDKEARRASILAAARDLFLRSPEKLPSSAMIAHTAGLAKGTVYLYFRTKEEIFMALLHDQRSAFLEQVHRAFPIDNRTRERKIAGYLKSYVNYVTEHPETMKLEALGYSILERNLGLDLIQAFKSELAASLRTAGKAVDDSLSLRQGQGIRLLMHTYAITLGLWQSLDYPDACREMMNDPASVLLQLDFRTELKEALAQYWRGLK